MTDQWHLLWLNPEPWAIGEVGYKRVSPNLTLRAFQEAVREELEGVDMMPHGLIKLRFYFWRQQARYIDLVNDRQRQRNQADATNMQKALEDALQGVLFDNDRNVRDIQSVIIAQGPDVEPKIVIRAQMFFELTEPAVHLSAMPRAVRDLMTRGPVAPPSENVWRGPSR